MSMYTRMRLISKSLLVMLAVLLLVNNAVYADSNSEQVGEQIMNVSLEASELPSSELAPIEDTFADEFSPAQNFGGAIRTIVRDVPGNGYDKIAYYKFDLSGLVHRIDRAVLRLYVHDIAPDVLATTVSAYSVADITWSESSLTWNNKPAIQDKLSITTAETINEWIELDVTDYIKQQITTGTVMSVAVLDDNQNNRAVKMYSKENNAFKPVLRISEEPPYIKGSSPASGEKHVSTIIQQLHIEFDRVMDTSTMNPSTILLVEGDSETVVPYTAFQSGVDYYNITVPHQLSFSTVYKVIATENVRDAEGTYLAQPDKIDFITLPETTDELTTTRYTPWWVNLHLTTPESIAGGKRGGEGAQRVWSYGVDPSNSNHVMLGSDTIGVYNSEDGGNTYQISSEGLEIIGTVDIAISPDDSNVAYMAATAGKQTDKTYVTVHSGIWKTTDRGQTWRQILHTPFYRYPSGYLIRFGAYDSNAGTRPIYVATHNEGILKSMDEGKSWTSLGLASQTIGDFTIDIDNGRLLAASYENGIMVSYDDGSSWQSMNNNLPSSEAYGISVHPDNSDFWVAVVDNTAYKSENAGSSWTALPRPSGINVSKKLRRVVFGASPGNGENPRLYVQAEDVAYNVRYSVDLGATWNTPVIDNTYGFTQGVKGFAADAMKPDFNDPYTIWTTISGNPFKSTDGGQTFVNASSGYSGHRASDFLFDENDDQNIFIALIDRGIAKSINPEKSGVYPMFEDLTDDNAIRYEGHETVHSIARDPMNPDHLIFNIGQWTTNTILAQTFDNGRTMQHIVGTEGDSIKVIRFHPQNPQKIYAGTRYSVDGGATWQFRDKNVVAVSPLNGDHIWGVIETDDLFTLYESTDAGATWVENSVFDSANTMTIHSVTADLTSENLYWVATDNGIYRFENGSLTHIGEQQGIVPNVDGTIEIFSIAQNPNNLSHYLAGGYNTNRGPSEGLFESLDGGLSWHLVPGMKGLRDIWIIEFHPNLPQAYIGTSHGTWVYEYDKFVDPAKYILTPTDDAYVNSILAERDANYGGADRLYARDAQGEGFDKQSFLKFDISNISGDIQSATLNLHNFQMNPYDPPVTIDVFATEENWNEATITWNNRPVVLQQLASVSISDTNLWERFDITDYIRAQHANLQMTVSFALRDTSEAEKAVLFYSKEASDKHSFLEIITTDSE